VTVNGRDAGGELKAWTHEGVAGWLLPLAGELPPDASIAERLAATRAAVGGKAAAPPVTTTTAR